MNPRSDQQKEIRRLPSRRQVSGAKKSQQADSRRPSALHRPSAVPYGELISDYPIKTMAQHLATSQDAIASSEL